jgi:hypothetical protein
MVIHFHPGKLGMKPDVLTRRWDVYHKGGNSDFVLANPSNLQPIFTQEQLSASLRATYFAMPIIWNAIIMDIEILHNDICLSLPLDPISAAQFPTPSDPKWTIDESGLLHLNNQIFVPDHADLRLKVLQYKHDHVLAGHFGQNKTLEAVCREYIWPNMCTFVKDFCSSCTTCKWSKAPRHKPYGLLKQLPVPKQPWNSISMDFIEHLPNSLGHTALLVVMDWLSKQGIFIPTTTISQHLNSQDYSLSTSFPNTEFPRMLHVIGDPSSFRIFSDP